MDVIPPPASEAEPPGTDGRRLRRSRTRDRLVAAARTLMRNGVWRPAVQEVSKVAGVSPRTICEIFVDRESLYRAALADAFVVHAIAKAVLGGQPQAGQQDAIAHAAVFGRPKPQDIDGTRVQADVTDSTLQFSLAGNAP